MEGKKYCPICEEELHGKEKLCKDCQKSYAKAKERYQRELQYA